MAYDLPADIQQRVQAQIESGRFQSADEVLREAISTLEKRQHGPSKLREMIQEAENDISAGRVAPFDANQTKAIVRERLRQQGIGE